MKKIRTLIWAALLALASTTAMADDYQYLTVSGSEGDNSFTVSNIEKITFDATNMVLHLSDGTTTQLPLSSLQKMFFTGTPSGIAATTAQSKMQFQGGMLRANLADGEAVALYNMRGELVFSTGESGVYDLSQFTRGVYIIKVGTETRKIINK